MTTCFQYLHYLACFCNIFCNYTKDTSDTSKKYKPCYLKSKVRAFKIVLEKKVNEIEIQYE